MVEHYISFHNASHTSHPDHYTQLCTSAKALHYLELKTSSKPIFIYLFILAIFSQIFKESVTEYSFENFTFRREKKKHAVLVIHDASLRRTRNGIKIILFI